ncbi:hypothetical protein K2173_021321 [Erythroxylum novogranatense]|uniref:Glutamyl-tRNA(Gln) amidotransferase subunit C, chloroplastic/mitochondrial n=1 Tax=Erythroxylum novogranatense TaxID=1862640 RepID=A0AAV8TX96_9ROSI|nr:hypothetical protein K2173_021321 [Erythroxylum novogranatense]
MESSVVPFLRGITFTASRLRPQNDCLNSKTFLNSQLLSTYFHKRPCSTNATSKGGDWSSLQPPDVSRLAQTARIHLFPVEVEEFSPKIRRVVDWLGQLQAVDLNRVEPAIRADTEGDILREDIPEPFGQRKAMIDSIPSYEESYIKVPKVLNKE